MNDAPALRVRDVELFEWPFSLRLPFRFGAITVTHGRQVVARLRIELADGRTAWGVAAESLAAKWFDKNPALSDEDNLDQLRRSLAIARSVYCAQPAVPAFRHAAAAYRPVLEAGQDEGLPPLVASYGPALLDRCVADALGRLLGLSFAELVRGNLLGFQPELLAPDLTGVDTSGFLQSLRPLPRLHVRHTVGMLDPIVAADQETRVGDGLPETLEEVIAAYGHRYFKLKVGGDVAADIARLTRIAGVLDTIAEPYHATLDGNEQYADADGVLELIRAIEREPRLERLRASLLYIEQPIGRALALERDVGPITEFAPLLLDETDGEIDIFPRGRALGYRGVSSKDCKGFYKSLINRMRCDLWNRESDGGYFMSGEDLTTLAGVSVQQDLALVSLLGLTHVERNGHHFVDGFNGRPEAEARAFLRAHPDLYHESNGRVRLRIEQGQVTIGSLACPGFASAIIPEEDAP
ncbi:MAG: mandelate racemase [Acidisphaera sp.]|nr:mandelate racemase [Acidisphaera sp.]